jgi:uncharacterized peroxidase-related enzyme
VNPISRFGTGSIADLPDDLRDEINAIAERTGFVPNVFLALANRPDELRPFLDLHTALMEKDSGLTKAEREMIVVATSGANNCMYCVVAHGAILRVRTKQPLLADQVAVNYRRADISPRQRAMLGFAVKVTTESHTLEETDFDSLRSHGFSDDDIWDIGAVTAFYGYSNRMADLMALTPNEEFYSMGRG